MRKTQITFILSAMLFAQPIFAMPMGSSDGKPCAPIVDACLKAGFDKETAGKNFWLDCMRPILLGQTVRGVVIDADAIQTCRTFKIKELKRELNDLQNAKAKSK